METKNQVKDSILNYKQAYSFSIFRIMLATCPLQHTRRKKKKKEYSLPTLPAFFFVLDSTYKTGREPVGLPNEQQHLSPQCRIQGKYSVDTEWTFVRFFSEKYSPGAPSLSFLNCTQNSFDSLHLSVSIK